MYVYKETQKGLVDVNNSSVELVSQVKGYFYVNPFIAIKISLW